MHLYRFCVVTGVSRCDDRGAGSNTEQTHTHTSEFTLLRRNQNKLKVASIERTKERKKEKTKYFATLYALARSLVRSFARWCIFMLLRARCVRSELNARGER